MRWFERLAKFIEKHDGARNIYRPDDVTGEPSLYLRRFYIVKTPWFEIMLHQFYMSDRGTYHDHPWGSYGRILATGYYEWLCDGIEKGEPVNPHKVFRKPGDWGGRPAANATHNDPRSFHKVELAPGTEGKVWTLFMTGPRVRDWGFLSVDQMWEHFSDLFKRDGTAVIAENHQMFKGWLFPKRVKQ